MKITIPDHPCFEKNFSVYVLIDTLLFYESTIADNWFFLWEKIGKTVERQVGMRTPQVLSSSVRMRIRKPRKPS